MHATISITHEEYTYLVNRVAALEEERKKTIALCQPLASPASNTETHELASRVLKILGERGELG